METIYQSENFKFVAIEVDPEENNYFYVLDEEQKLYHLFDSGNGKCLVTSTSDLSVHSLEEIIEDFLKNHNWVSVPIDKRSITIRNYTYSTTTNFSWKLVKGDGENKQRWRRSVGKRAQCLLY